MWKFAELKENARYNFRNGYWSLVLAGLIYSLAAGGVSSLLGYAINAMVTGSATPFNGWKLLIILLKYPLFGIMTGGPYLYPILLRIFFYNPLMIGVNKYFVERQMKQKPDFKVFLFGFNNSYGRIVLTMLQQYLLIGLLSLLIVPGIYKSLEWRLVPYILTENPDISASEARRKSAEMMDGNKCRVFVLDLTFIGWVLLSNLSFGLVAIFYVIPYMQLTYAELYASIKAENPAILDS